MGGNCGSNDVPIQLSRESGHVACTYQSPESLVATRIRRLKLQMFLLTSITKVRELRCWNSKQGYVVMHLRAFVRLTCTRPIQQ